MDSEAFVPKQVFAQIMRKILVKKKLHRVTSVWLAAWARCLDSANSRDPENQYISSYLPHTAQIPALLL
jgi:hypothetical protein